MAGKQRLGKIRIDDAAEVAAWTEFFVYGIDYLDELRGVVKFDRIHFDECPYTKAPRDRRDQRCSFCELHEIIEAAPAAWARLGARFMSEVWPDYKAQSKHLDTPYGLRKFGGP